MKKSLLTTPKKLLLATSILAMSTMPSTVMAATTDLSTAVTDSMLVKAHYVVPLTVALDLAEIDFGDIFETSTVDLVTVTANLTGTIGETFDYLVTTTNDKVADFVVLSDISGDGTNAFAGTAGALGTAAIDFGVTLAPSVLTTAGTTGDDIQETITVAVTYNAIAPQSPAA
jgi:hypothetical protein